MKATGIVRRIDDLGRVVIPKEIRRTLKIREGGLGCRLGQALDGAHRAPAPPQLLKSWQNFYAASRLFSFSSAPTAFP